VFVLALATVVVVGLVRGASIHPLPPTTQARTVGAVGIGLLLAAFANGCSALTGVEAIANATPSLRADSRVRARRSEALLGVTLGLLLLGLATLIVRFNARPVERHHRSCGRPNCVSIRLPGLAACKATIE